MDPALLKQKEAFKKRALEATTSTSHPRNKKEQQKKTKSDLKVKKSRLLKSTQRPQPQPSAKCEFIAFYLQLVC